MGIYRTGAVVVLLVFLAGAAALADVIATAPSKVQTQSFGPIVARGPGAIAGRAQIGRQGAVIDREPGMGLGNTASDQVMIGPRAIRSRSSAATIRRRWASRSRRRLAARPAACSADAGSDTRRLSRRIK